MARTIRYDPFDNDYEFSVVVEHIIRLSKSRNGELTNIHLSTGEVLPSHDSINTLEARINHVE